jgi:two-component system OmpR family response regulator
MAQRILVADDDPHIREVICFALEKAGMVTDVAVDGVAALRMAQQKSPDLLVLDIGMPEMDGLDVCRELRKTSNVPILFLSARDEEIDRILGLEMGGDDYVTKPFSPRELVTRVNVILRRARPAPIEINRELEPLVHGLLVLDQERHFASFAGRGIEFTPIEFAIIKSLMAKPAHVLNRDQIMSSSHAVNIHISDRTMDSHIRNIRAKFAVAGCVNAIETVHGIGFRLGRCSA